MSSSFLHAVAPCGALVVEGAVPGAAVEDADEAVSEGAEGPVVGVAAGSPGWRDERLAALLCS